MLNLSRHHASFVGDNRKMPLLEGEASAIPGRNNQEAVGRSAGLSEAIQHAKQELREQK